MTAATILLFTAFTALAVWSVSTMVADVWDVRRARGTLHRQQVSRQLSSVASARGRHPSGWRR